MKPNILLATATVALMSLVSNAVAQPGVYTPKSPVELMQAIAKQGRSQLTINSKGIKPTPTDSDDDIQNKIYVPAGIRNLRNKSLQPGSNNITIVHTAPKPTQPVDAKSTSTSVPQPVANPDGKYNTESSRMFATKVQPILNNMCATCHTKAESAGGFVLKRMDENYANPEAVEHNLRATVRYLNPESPGMSAFLMNAVTAHGTSKEPPIRTRMIPAFRTLELWSHWATSGEGSPMPNFIPVATATKSTMVINSSGTPTGFAAGEIQQVGAKEPAAKPGTVPHLTVGTSSKEPPVLAPSPGEPGKLPPLTPATTPPATVPQTPAPQVNDPYSPEMFNKYAFPNRK